MATNNDLSIHPESRIETENNHVEHSYLGWGLACLTGPRALFPLITVRCVVVAPAIPDIQILIRQGVREWAPLVWTLCEKIIA